MPSPPSGDERTRRLLGALALVAGLALVLNATVVGAFAVGEPVYRYDTLAVETEGGIGFGGGSPVDTVPDDVVGLDCLYDSAHTRLCETERWLLDRSANDTVTVTVESPESVYVEEPAPRFALHPSGIYERTRTLVEENGTRTARLTLERVATREAVAAVAADPDELPRAAERAVEDGPVTTRERLGVNGQVVVTENGFGILVADRARPARPGRATGFAAAQLLAAAGLFAAGSRPFRRG
ncbi:hypothetical protein [Halosegnis marinus]|uniref:Uncharacterized protein n=1 Tax=Halosegnis marinus TaxID=3034023 RepID=A0ABD5ZQT8_9EURY|nr:hypothetical protein [Halosegnis sp. DT85]